MKRQAPDAAVPQERSIALLLGLVIVAALITLLGIYKVWYHYQTIGLGYQLAEETVRHRKLFGENRTLRIELESLERERLPRFLASGAVGMEFPGPEDIVTVSASVEDGDRK